MLGRRAKLRLFWGYRSGRSFKVWIQASGLEGWGSRSFKAYVCLGSVSVGLGRCEAFRVQGLLGSGCFFSTFGSRCMHSTFRVSRPFGRRVLGQ